MFERFTERARRVVVFAQEEARALVHNYIGTEHLLLGLLREQEGAAAQVLESLGLSAEPVRAQVVRIVGAGEEVTAGRIPFNPRAKKVLELALREALDLGHNDIGTEHILLGLVRVKEGVAVRILRDSGADPETVRLRVSQTVATPDIEQRAAGAPFVVRGPEPERDLSWLEGLAPVLVPLGAEIRGRLRRPPDIGDLLIACACLPGTVAAEALAELGVDLEALTAAIEAARARMAELDPHAQRPGELSPWLAELRRRLGLLGPGEA